MPMTGLPWRPIVTYGTPSKVIGLSLPQKLWGYKTKLQGGAMVVSSGVGEAYTIREDNIAKLTLRVHDCEYLQVRDWIVYSQRTQQPFQFQFDADDPFSNFQCYLDEPTFDSGFEPRRMQNWPQVWEVDVAIRAVLQVPIFVGVVPECGTTGVVEQAWVLTNFANPETGELRLSVPPPPPTFGSSAQFANLPDPMTDPDVLYISDPAEAIWDTLILTDGILLPSAVLMEAIGPTPEIGFDRAGGFFKIKHMRGSTVLAEATSPQMGFGSLVTSFVSFNVSSIGTLYVEVDDFIRLELYGYMSPAPSGGTDPDYRPTYYYGAVFGPRSNPRLVCMSNVEEQI